ncbi:hypothetical protein L484_014080 [Morus notabilis]|uniref:Uncharacterized protein n=1 Tax=Morus notabilis TaxID=981085 RepID=W9RK53_9ROSA|nr:hypothetical protein L484_014080 [Morus notabilis]
MKQSQITAQIPIQEEPGTTAASVLSLRTALAGRLQDAGTAKVALWRTVLHCFCETHQEVSFFIIYALLFFPLEGMARHGHKQRYQLLMFHLEYHNPFGSDFMVPELEARKNSQFKVVFGTMEYFRYMLQHRNLRLQTFWFHLEAAEFIGFETKQIQDKLEELA